MADNLYFSRDTKVYLAIGAVIWEIPVLDGFSFSQATNTSEVALNEMAASAGVTRRGRKVFNDSYAPAEWSFSTYARPFISAGSGSGAADSAAKNHAVEEALWGLMVGTGAYAANSFNGCTNGTTSAGLEMTFANSNIAALGTGTLYFVLGDSAASPENTVKQTYRITEVCVNEATIDFDVEGIATINWSGFGSLINEHDAAVAATIYEGAGNTDNFIRNRLTTCLINGQGAAADTNFNLALTGGSISVSNNLTHLIPETLGTVNHPIGNVTGTRNIGGNLTCYLNAAADSSAELLETLAEDTDGITNSYSTTIKIGGTGTPRIELVMATCHLEIPTTSIEDIISVDINFHALPSDIDGTNEMTIKYVGA